MNTSWIDAFVLNALEEDIGDGDHTSLACIPPNTTKTAHLLCKEAGIIAGIALAERIFQRVDNALVFAARLSDGNPVSPGNIAFDITGNARSILTAERLVLNCMQRMSGIATATARMAHRIEKYPAKLLDTRKTTPGFRAAEKWAVALGGGQNHRFGLFDMMMIKDNHIDYAGGIEAAIKAANLYLQQTGKKLAIEIEVRSMDELETVLQTGNVQRIMLDNFTPSQLKVAIEHIAGRYETEASGGITEDSIVDYAKSGVDYISVGALTHQVKSLDMSLKAV